MSQKQWVLCYVVKEEQGLTGSVYGGGEGERGPSGHVAVCAGDRLVAELRVLGLYGKKQGWINGEGKLEAQNKAFEDGVMKQWGMLEEFKAQSKMTGAKGKEHYLL